MEEKEIYLPPAEGGKATTTKPKIEKKTPTKKKSTAARGTLAFKETIRAYLEKCAYEDPKFDKKYRNPKKNLDDCVSFIINKVKASKRNAYANEEIFGYAMHYYDEKDVKVGNKITGGVKIVIDDTLPRSKDKDIKPGKAVIIPDEPTKESNQLTLL